MAITTKETPKEPSTKSGFLDDKKNKDEVYRLILMIENTFASFGVYIKVVEVHVEDKHILFDLELSMGTKLSKVMALDKDLAFAVASPSGDVEIYPIKGRSLVEIKVPLGKMENKLKKEKYKIIRIGVKTPEIDEWTKIKRLVRIVIEKIGDLFYWLSNKLT